MQLEARNLIFDTLRVDTSHSKLLLFYFSDNSFRDVLIGIL